MDFEFSSNSLKVVGETNNPLLQQRAAEALFGDVRFRPTAQTMASLIEQGLTEDDILAVGNLKGYKTPIMHETLQDLDVALPYIHQLSDRIADDHSDSTLWFAARDFEAVADDFLIRYPRIDAHLLPASQKLFEHDTMYDTNLATRFLGRFGLTAARVSDPRKKFAVFDSGFRGSIGQTLDSKIDSLYGVSLDAAGRLANKLVSVNTKYSLGEQIMSFPGGASNFSEERLPRASRCARSMRAEDFSDTQVLAAFLQTLPRFHNHFEQLAEINDSVVALPQVLEYEEGYVIDNIVDDNVDRLGDGDYGPNASIINPLAAAVVMYRIVKSALEQPSVSREAFADRQNPTTHEYRLLPGMSALYGSTIAPSLLPSTRLAKIAKVVFDLEPKNY